MSGGKCSHSLHDATSSEETQLTHLINIFDLNKVVEIKEENVDVKRKRWNFFEERICGRVPQG